MRNRIHDSIVVLTGAGSGIGEATAVLFARRGAKLALAGRSEPALERVAQECRQFGADVLVLATDTRDRRSVERLAKRTVDRFGRVDVWVNNAAVALYGTLEESPPELYEEVLRTNLFGYMNGMRTALRQFRQQGFGTIINNLSIVGKIGVPYLSSYAVSKAAVFMLSECVRQELVGSPFQVCSIVTPSVDTGVYERSGNITGRAVRPFPPVYSPERIARAIVSCAERPRREVNVGALNYLMTFGHTFTPALFERVSPMLMKIGGFQRGKTAERTSGNLQGPREFARGTRAGWLEQQRNMALVLASLFSGAAAVTLLATRTKSDRRREPETQPRAA